MPDPRNDETHKFCKHCGKSKLRTKFTKLVNGWRPKCHECCNKAARLVHESKKHDPEYRSRCSERVRAWIARDPEHARRVRRESGRKDKGWTPEMFNAAWAKSELCRICDKRMVPEGRGTLSVNVDHDHATGKPRDLLCGMCNKGLGHFFDSTDTLRRAVDYMEKWAILNGELPHAATQG